MGCKILFINDNSAHPNWGAQASAELLKHQLANETHARLEVLTWDWLRSNARKITLPMAGKFTFQSSASFLGRVASKLIGEPDNPYPLIMDDFNSYADRWLNRYPSPAVKEFMKKAEGSDAIVFNAENSIYRNTIEGRRALFLVWLTKTRLKKISCVINQTAHLTGVKPVLNAIVRHVYPKMDLVTCREPVSQRQLSQMGLQNILCIPDPVFGFERDSTVKDKTRLWLSSKHLVSRQFFCLSTSGLPSSKPDAHQNGAICELVTRIKNLGLEAVVLAKDPHCSFLEAVAHRTGSCFFGPEHHYSELPELFDNAAFLISGHYHYNIFASLSGCPFIPMSTNNHKMEGLCELLDWVFSKPYDVTDVLTEMDSIESAAREIISNREKLGSALRSKANELKKQANGNAILIRNLIEKSMNSQRDGLGV